MTEENSSQMDNLMPVPVSPHATGNGLPYAPENWPKQGDIWSWKVSGRISKSGHFADRYLFPPERFGKAGLGSRVKVQEFIKKEFPNADIDTFFSTFIWKIPCEQGRGSHKRKINTEIQFPKSESEPIPDGHCKARNKTCKLESESKSEPESEFFACDICCEEPGFCRECTCILCCSTEDFVCAGYTFFRCIKCGHGAHIKCAHRCFLAGVVGGSIGLDAEYYCRRCDNKVDMVPHLVNFFRILKESEDGNVERILSLGLCVLSGAKRETAKNLHERMDSALVKIKGGTLLGEVLQEDMISANCISGDINNTPNDETDQKSLPDTQPAVKACKRKVEFDNNEDIINKKQQIYDNGSEPDFLMHNTFDQKDLNEKLNSEIQQILQELKKMEEEQFKIPEEKLYSQRDHVLKLYQILELERSDMADPIVRQCNDGETYKALVERVVSRLDEVHIEEDKLRSLLKNCDLFIQRSKGMIKEYFGVEDNGLLNVEIRD